VGANPIVLGTDATFIGSNTLTMGGTVALGANRNITVNANTLSLTGVISGTNFGFTKLGLGTLALGSVTNTYTGSSTITAGVLSIPAGTALPAGSVTTIAGLSAVQPATLSYSGGGTSDMLAGADLNLGTVSNANIIEVVNSAGILQMRTPASTVTIAAPANSNRITGGAAGIVSYIKSGPGTFSSDSGNSNTPTSPFLGDVRIINGTLTSCQSSGTLANTQLFGAGTLFLDRYVARRYA
jgi:fibronectin-binding autotransporter adhesin